MPGSSDPASSSTHGLFKGVKVHLLNGDTGFPCERDTYLVESNAGTLVSDILEADVIVVGFTSQTFPSRDQAPYLHQLLGLSAQAKGTPCVSWRWVYESLAKQVLLPKQEFTLPPRASSGSLPTPDNTPIASPATSTTSLPQQDDHVPLLMKGTEVVSEEDVVRPSIGGASSKGKTTLKRDAAPNPTPSTSASRSNKRRKSETRASPIAESTWRRTRSNPRSSKDNAPTGEAAQYPNPATQSARTPQAGPLQSRSQSSALPAKKVAKPPFKTAPPLPAMRPETELQRVRRVLNEAKDKRDRQKASGPPEVTVDTPQSVPVTAHLLRRQDPLFLTVPKAELISETAPPPPETCTESQRATSTSPRHHPYRSVRSVPAQSVPGRGVSNPRPRPPPIGPPNIAQESWYGPRSSPAPSRWSPNPYNRPNVEQ